ncbi:MAG: dynamin-like GTPase mgm1 [Chrysothrix sp. TS-e1954]|nr:MAG: dynamin-like GTPase mgm1 [Chrysothrix sp. TS-e1954]
MSGRLLTNGLAPLARRATAQSTRRLAHHCSVRSTGSGLLRNDSLRTSLHRSWPPGSNAIHNVPAVRNISFVRNVPSLFLKLFRIPAMFGGAAVAGLAYIQYQANQAGTYAVDLFRRAGDSASMTANSWFQNLSEAADQTRQGFQKTRDGIEVPEWYQRIMNGEGSSQDGEGGGSNKGPRGNKESSVGGGAAAGGAATAAAFGLTSDSEEDDRKDSTGAKDDQMMLLTKKMIEIRGLLQQVGQSDALTLPSIVVVGSQSSGKSSVLEAIVGHEFLPKGSNMVTRRPIELTLVNTPDAKAEYGEFPAIGLGKITDFAQVQKTLTDLNLAVPEKDCVSDDPIQLRIYSPKVPDLSLIDLPGYIQVSGYDQPTQLKQKITDLCDKYIRAPNIILAISAADVDLANSTSLRASRRVDPRGERTIGVITKMDLVEPEQGSSKLNDKKYPLRLGYVGVVCKVPQSAGFFNRGSGNITNAIVKSENAYFTSHPQFSSDAGVTVGTVNLRKKLMHVLEQTMSASLAGTSDAIHQELAEANYEFKVQYNDRPLSAESYLAESVDAFKHSFKGFTEQFGREEIRKLVKHELDQQVLNLLAQRYWNKPLADISPGILETSLLAGLPKADPEDPIWHHKLEASRSALTKLGIGRLATGVVASSLQAHIDQLISNSTFNAHPFARSAITEASTTILKDLSYDTSDELEICIKPYKYRTEVEDSDWNKGRENVTLVLKDELSTCESAFANLEKDVGGKRKLRDVLAFIDRVRKGEIVLEGDGVGGAGGFSAALLVRGREAVFLRDRAEIIKMRMKAVKSKQCANKKNTSYCPEVFLDAVAERLTSTADLFLDAELLSKFYYLFPRELDAHLGRNLSAADIERFAREDPKIKRHLDVVKRKEMLELVLKETDRLRQLEGRERRIGGVGSRQTSSSSKGSRWSIL